MALLFQPVLRFYGVSPLYGLLLPLIGGIYVWFTCMSALQHASGRDSLNQSAVASISGFSPSTTSKQVGFRVALRHKF